jgi:two-component system phosphate regulon sensor histidine kinase PhoR
MMDSTLRPHMFVLRTLIPVAIALLVALLLVWLGLPQWAVWWLAAALSLYALYHAAYLDRLHHWSALPKQRELPLGSGPWAMVLERLSRHARQEAESQAELHGELARIHAAVDQLPDGLVVLDRFSHVVWANNAAESLHGIFGRGRPIHHFIRQPEFVQHLESGDPSEAVTMQLTSRPGRVFELRLHPIDDQQKLLISRDISEHAKLDAMRRDFVANVSHEIRTPVTVIGGFAETLLNLDLDEDSRREYLGNILKHGQTMQRLVDDLLMLSTLENSSVPPEEEDIDVGTMMQAIAADGRVLSNERHLIALSTDSASRLRAAAVEMESAIRNLLTNAIRYTPEGGCITLGWTVRGDGGWLSVQDTGIGIAAEHLPRLTERFYRVERSRSRATGGTGLGLAIVKHIAQRHQARLHIRSTPGAGSTFSLQFPIERLRAATTGARVAA